MSLKKQNIFSNLKYQNAILIFLALLVIKPYCYQIDIPNYELLRSRKILTQNFTLNYVDQFEGQNEKTENQQKIELMNEAENRSIFFEMFIYPYRLYSYFDELNKKQYIFRKIGFEEFGKPNFINSNGQSKSQHQSLLNSSLNIKQCLFGRQPSSSLPQNQRNTKTQTLQKECFTSQQLYSLLPSLLTITQQEHQQIKVQRINSEYLLIKNYANPNSSHEVKFYLNLDLFRVNIHSFIYEARLALLQYLFDEINKININQGEQKTKENGKIDQSQSQISDNLSQKTDSLYNVILNQFLNNQFQLWTSLYDKNRAILSNLFEFQSSVSINKTTKFDYVASASTFYLVKIDQNICPPANNKESYSFFSNQDPPTQQSPQSQNYISTSSLICTYLTIYRTPFIQFESPEPIEYISREKFFKNVQHLSLGLIEMNQKKNLNRIELCIQIITKDMIAEIWYGSNWKEIRTKWRHQHNPTDKNKNKLNPKFTENQLDEQPIYKVVFLRDLTKVWITDNLLTVYKQSEAEPHVFIQKCQVKLEPYVLTAQKISNQLVIVCVQGSTCYVYNKKCQILAKKNFINAFGIEWQYKINYVQNKIRSYISAYKRSEKLQEILPTSLDTYQIQQQNLKSNHFHKDFTVVSLQQSLFELKQQILISQVDSNKKNATIQFNLNFKSMEIPYMYKAIQLFSDNTYLDPLRFKQKFLDYVLKDYLRQNFQQFYMPSYSLKHNKNINFLDFSNQTQFNQFFNDCHLDKDNGTIKFLKNWNGCKVSFKTETLLVVDSVQKQIVFNNATLKPSEINSNNTAQKSSKVVSKDIKNDKNDHIQDNPQTKMEKHLVQIYVQQNNFQDTNLLIVCSMHKNSPPYSKCKVSQYQITPYFYQSKRKAKFFLDGGKHFQLYFFNRKFMTQAPLNLSFLELLESLAHDKSDKTTQKLADGLLNLENQPEHQKAQLKQLKQFKIVYAPKSLKGEAVKEQFYDIFFIDYERQQMQNISKVLLVGYCIFFPTLAIFCCVVCFKTYFQNILVYYGVIHVEPSFRYPLNSLALKIKIKDLKKNGYAKIKKNKVDNKKITTQGQSSNDIKFSIQCCFCLEQLKLNEQVAQLYCKHEFHSECFIQWVKNEPNTKCPLCKRTFTKTALSEFNNKIQKVSPQKPVQYFSDQNQNQEHEESNQIQMLEFEQ